MGRDAQVSTSTGRSDGRTEGQSAGVELGYSPVSVSGGVSSERAVTHTRERQRTETVIEGLARLELLQVE